MLHDDDFDDDGNPYHLIHCEQCNELIESTTCDLMNGFLCERCWREIARENAKPDDEPWKETI